MEYLILFGGSLRLSFEEALGQHAPFFMDVVAPAALALVWIGSAVLLLLTWFGPGGDPATRGSPLLKVFLTGFWVVCILISGAGLEFLLLGNPSIHAEVLGGAIDLIRMG